MSKPLDPVQKTFGGIWEGENKIIIGVDIGTTQSGVAFAFLEQGSEPVIHRVTHWPGQEAQYLTSKVPTLVWYDNDKRAVAFGAEALMPQVEETAEDVGWQLAKHFKLHLHPSELKTRYKLKLNPLPTGVSLHQIYSDFLGYLLRHTQTYFEDRIVDGKRIWEKYRSSMEFIIAHPNGWGLREQTFLQLAAVKSGFATNDTAPTNIRFVTEAEASVHFCIHNTNLGSCLEPGTKFAVCDAGGSTVDTTVYSVVTARPSIKLEEARASACVQAGAIFIDAAAEKFLQNTLTSAGLDEMDVEDYVTRGTRDFEKSAKRNFSNSLEDKTVEIAGPRFTNSAIRTRRGHMTISGGVIKSFFDVCVDEIKESVDQQLDGMAVSHVLLVGGFGDSHYLRQVFKDRYQSERCQITLTNDSTSKAVADGAIMWRTMSSVTGRALRSSIGLETSVRFNPALVDHQGRQVIACPSGQEKVHGRWSQIVAKDTVIDVAAVVKEPFSRAFSTKFLELEDFKITLMSYSENGEPLWARDKQDALLEGFHNSCTISANLTDLSGALEPRIGAHGSMYWRLYFQVCIRFGGTELEAYLEWEEKGAVRTSTVKIVPDDPVDG